MAKKPHTKRRGRNTKKNKPSQDKVEEIPEEVVVYATAVIDISNSDKVYQADLNSIDGLIFIFI